MDEYAFSYVSQESTRLEALRPPTPREAPLPLPLESKVVISPPVVCVRKRAASIPQVAKKGPVRFLDRTEYETYETQEWFVRYFGRLPDLGAKDDTEFSDSDDDIEDAELIRLRDINIARLASCQKLLARAEGVLETLGEIKQGFELVSQQTSSLQASCIELQADETRLSALSEDIKANLHSFSYLATAERLLNAPGSDLVLQANYQEMLRRVQSSLDFLAKHQDYKDAELYTRRYRQIMTKALTLARVYFSSSIREICSDITARTQVNAMNKNTQSALLYTKFRSSVSQVRPLMRNIEVASASHAEYWSILNDCWRIYFGARKGLLASMISHAFKELANIADFVSFSTSAISFMRVLVLDEKELFASFFQSGQQEFIMYLESLGQYFTDALRPRIAAEASLNTLCEICGSMQAQCAQYSEDQDSFIFDMTPILSVTLGEIQSRIVLRAQGVIINEIQGYKPTEKDLDYPDCLKRSRRIGAQAHLNGEHQPSRLSLQDPLRVESIPDNDSTSPRTLSFVESGDLESLSSAVLYERWYVTLQVSISLLSKIYKLVQSSIFDSLAHEVVRSCIASLLHASNLLRRRKPIDGYLFLLKHLLILKEQISAFDIQYNETQVSDSSGLSTMTSHLWDITSRSATELFTPSGLYQLATSTISKLSDAGYLSRKVENMTDARDELDDQTRLVIGSLTLHCADSVTAPLRSMMGNRNQNSADLLEANRKFRASCPDSFAQWQAAFEPYTTDSRIVSVLLGFIQDKVLETFERFDSYVKELKKQKSSDGAAIEVELPSLIDTVDWLKAVTG